MKVTTDPETGRTSAVLNDTERKTLAAAKSVLHQFAYYNSEADGSNAAIQGAMAIYDVLAPETVSKTETDSAKKSKEE